MGILCLFIAWTNVRNAQSVGDFRLLDHRGDSHRLYYYSHANAVTILGHGTYCGGFRDDLRRFAELASSFDGRDGVFLVIAGDERDERDTILTHLAGGGVAGKIPVLIDTRFVARSMGLTHAGDVVVLDTRNWNVAYRGRLGSESLLAFWPMGRPGPVTSVHFVKTQVVGSCNLWAKGGRLRYRPIGVTSLHCSSADAQRATRKAELALGR